MGNEFIINLVKRFMDLNVLTKSLTNFYIDYDKARSGIAHDEQDTFIHLVEEVGELAAEFVNQKYRKARFTQEKYDDAVGDILINLLYLAGIKNIDLELLLRNTVIRDAKKFNLAAPEM